MEWEFAPEQVVKAQVGYAIDNFRLDLYREVQINTGLQDPSQLKATYELLFDLCYWLATGRDFAAFVAQYHHSPPTCEFLRGVEESMRPNAEMLGAILQRMIMDGVEKGTDLGAAVAAVHGTVRRLTAQLPL